MTDVHRRRQPLRADDGPAGRGADADGSLGDGLAIQHVATAHERTDDDRRRFATAVQSLRTGGGSLNLSERTLMVLGGVIAPLGLVVVLLGWVGASRTPNVFEQVPYLISGGLFGLGLVFLGAFFYFAHWLTELVKEQRAQSAALLDAIGRLRDDMATAAAPPVSVSSAPGAVLVATAHGSMAHRPDCAVVAGKPGLRAVGPADGLAACKLCEPYALEPSVN